MSTATSATRSSILVRLGRQAYTKAKEYSQITGVPISRVLDNAVEHWMFTVGRARLEAFTQVRSDTSLDAPASSSTPNGVHL